MDPHIFADQDHDPGSQNLAYLTDPDPVKNACLEHYNTKIYSSIIRRCFLKFKLTKKSRKVWKVLSDNELNFFKT